MPRDRRGDFGTFIGIHRAEQGLTQTQMVGVCSTIKTQTAYSNWETGKFIPASEDDVRAIARRLGIAEERLVSIWQGDHADRQTKGENVVTRAYNTTSDGGGTTRDAYKG